MGFGQMKEPELRQHIEEVFGESLTASQLWAILKLMRHGAKYCRNGAARTNFMIRMFPYAQFREVPKTDPRTGLRYKGLQITVRGEAINDSEDATEAA